MLRMTSLKRIVIFVTLFLVVFMLYKFIDKPSLIGVIYESLPPREAGLLSAIVWGDKTGLDNVFVKDLRVSGLIHLAVVSGTNIMLISGLLIEGLAKYLGRKVSIVFGLIIVWAYIAMVGWEAPIIRAVLFVTVFYWSQMLGRRFSVKRSLVLVVILMIMADTKILTEPSFWLSMTAFIGVITVPKFKWRNIFLKDGFLALWVGLWVTPVLAFNFGEFSIIGPLSNGLVIFAIEFVTVLGGLASMIGVLVPIIGKLSLYLALPVLKYIVLIADLTGSIEWVSVSFNFNGWILAGWYLILFYFLRRRGAV